MKRSATALTAAILIALPASSEEINAERNVIVNGVELTLEFVADPNGHADMVPLAKHMRDAYFKFYPSIIKWLGVPLNDTPKKTIVTFRSDTKHPGRTVGNHIEISVPHLRRDPGDTLGLFIHELSHVMQAFKPGAPSWFTEGSADYVRFRAFPASPWAQESREHQTVKNQPFGHYWKSTAFLLWMEETHRKTIVQEMTLHCRNGTYRPALWKELTGNDLNALAAEYAASAWLPPLK